MISTVGLSFFCEMLPVSVICLLIQLLTQKIQCQCFLSRSGFVIDDKLYCQSQK